jgi:DNA-binding NarL/FixJ family response regulator
MVSVSVSSVRVRLLHDDGGLWSRALAALGDEVEVLGDDGGDGDQVIGVVTWKRATRAEVAQLAALRETHAGPLVAILAELPSTRGSRAVAARVEGSVLAADLERSLLATLRAVAVGQCVVPRSVRQLVDRPPLSARERQILAMVVLDYSNAEIARKLVVTESNVKGHLTSAFKKIGVSSRAAAVELILDAESGLGLGILRISPDEDELP